MAVRPSRRTRSVPPERGLGGTAGASVPGPNLGCGPASDGNKLLMSKALPPRPPKRPTAAEPVPVAPPVPGWRPAAEGGESSRHAALATTNDRSGTTTIRATSADRMAEAPSNRRAAPCQANAVKSRQNVGRCVANEPRRARTAHMLSACRLKSRTCLPSRRIDAIKVGAMKAIFLRRAVSLLFLGPAIGIFTGEALADTAAPPPPSVPEVAAPVPPAGGTAFDLSTDFDLSLEKILNMEVTTTSKSAEKLSDAPGMISVVTRDELDRFGGTTLRDILNRVPGLIGISGYMTDRSMMAARGDSVKGSTTSRHILVLINGRPVREVQEGGIKSDIYETFPVDTIDHIEVVKGPGSVLYGSEAFSGVINVITEKPDESSVSVTALGGADRTYGVSSKGTVRAGDFTLLLAGRYLLKAEWPVTYSYGASPNGSVAGTLDQRIPNKAAAAYLETSFKGLKLTGSYDQWETSYFLPDALIIPAMPGPVGGNARWRRIFANAGYTLAATSKWSVTFDATYNRSFFDILGNRFPNLTRDSNEALGEVTNFFKVTDKANLVVGGLVSHLQGKESIKGGGPTVSEGSRSSYAVYAQGDYRILESLKAIGGFQANKIGSINLNVVPRAGLIWHPIKRVNVKALYGEAFRAPYLNENHIDHPGLLGNPDLTPEMVRSIDLGVAYMGQDWDLGASYFNNQQRAIINYTLTTAPPIRLQYVNNGTVSVQGAELEGKYYLSRALFVSGSFLYQKSSDDTGNQDTGIATVGAKGGVSYRARYGVVSLFNVFQGAVAGTLYNANSPNPRPGAYNLLSFYGNLDVNGLMKLHLKQTFSVSLQADNLLGQAVWVPASGNPFPDVLPYDRGRTVYASLKASF
jgi:outer membrane receptor for ferrienterochelin and colicins